MIRATVTSMLNRKLRLALSSLAIVLSVTFISGTLVFLDAIDRTLAAAVDQIVESKIIISGAEGTGDVAASQLAGAVDATTTDGLRDVSGVAETYGQVNTWNAFTVLDAEGKPLTTTRGVMVSNMEYDTVRQLATGRPPAEANEVAINTDLAESGGFTLGSVLALRGADHVPHWYTVVGINTCRNGVNSCAGALDVVPTQAEAQRLAFGVPGYFHSVLVVLVHGADADEVAAGLRAALGDRYQVTTGEQAADEAVQEATEETRVIGYFLLGFGGLALLVGAFLIFNTFSIVVAQRTAELALLRALGASRPQVRRAVLVEASLVGTIGSALGLALGLGLGRLAGSLLVASGSGLDLASLRMPISALVTSFGVGIGAAVASAVVPARRAARISPLAAMRSAEIDERPLTRTGVAGAVLAAVGVTSVLAGTLRERDDAPTYALLLGGVLAVLLGAALLAALLSRPVCLAAWHLLSWSVPGRLGSGNAAGTPRRTAVTASAIMLGVAVVGMLSTVAATTRGAVQTNYQDQVHADLIAAVPSDGPEAFDPATVAAARQVAGVDGAVGVGTFEGLAEGEQTTISSIDDLAASERILGLTAHDGTIDSLSAGQVIADRYLAEELGVRVGDSVRIQMDHGGERRYTLVGTFEENSLVTGFVCAEADLSTGYGTADPRLLFLTVADGADTTQVRTAIETIFETAEVSVSTRQEYLGEVTQGIDQLLSVVQVLLTLTMLIASLGVVNTLALSIVERTRELGTLRVIGMFRGQLARMVIAEGMVISLFGAVLGLAVGSGLGSTMVVALNGATVGERADLVLPWEMMGYYLVGALLLGAVAGALPALRASRLRPLAALAS